MARRSRVAQRSPSGPSARSGAETRATRYRKGPSSRNVKCPRFPHRAAALLGACLLILWGESLCAAVETDIRPPFGLTWATDRAYLEPKLQAAKARIVSRRTVEGREAWQVEGLKRQGLRRAVFYFKGNLLDEVELQYDSPSWDAWRYKSFLSQLRQRIEAKYGKGQVIAKSKKPNADVVETLLGYQWIQQRTTLLLFYFKAERKPHVYHAVSLHYKRN